MLGVFKKNKSKKKVKEVVAEERLVKKSSKGKELSRNKKVMAMDSKVNKGTKLTKESKIVKEGKNSKNSVKSSTKKENNLFVKDDSTLFGISSEFSVERVTTMLQKRLYRVTRLSYSEQEYFEKLYKIAHVISYSKKVPKWLAYYDLMFIGEEHAIIISKFNTSAGPLVSIKEIMSLSLKLDSLTTLFFKLEFLINQMIKMYNEGKNYNYHFKDSVKELKTLGLIFVPLYEKLMFLADIRSKVGRAWCAGDIKFYLPNGKIDVLKNKENVFKYILSEVYVDIIEIYMKVQVPYLKKFYLLWEDKALNIGSPNAFYRI